MNGVTLKAIRSLLHFSQHEAAELIGGVTYAVGVAGRQVRNRYRKM